MNRCAPGTCAVLRYFSRGRIMYALPMMVVVDDPERVVLWIAAETRCKRPAGPVTLEQRATGVGWTLTDKPWSDGPSTLMLFAPGDAHATWLFWNGHREFTGWYVNLEEPWRRTAIGFDTSDQLLDIGVDPDGSWRWLDEDDLAEATQIGLFSAADAEAIRAEGERVVQAWPFPTGWEHWEPDPGWGLPELPSDWDRPAD